MRLPVLIFVAIAFAPPSKGGEILNIGDAAPALAVSSWVKGEKVERFEPGKTYVVEFWATWCGPCKKSIPHLTELAHRFKDQGVRFVGVDVWERETERVKPFVDEMGDQMDYAVALDTVPEGGTPQDGAMAKTWMQAAEETGIPTAFLIQNGKIAWIGHPLELDGPLTKVVAGDWDASALVKTRLVEKTRERKATVLREKVFPLYNARDYKATIAAIDEAASRDPELGTEFAWLKFAALCNGGDIEQGLELGARLYELNKDKSYALNNLFWNVINPRVKDEVDPRVARLALRAARRAVELEKGENANHLDTLAEAQYRTGDFDGAVATQEKAIKLAEAEARDAADPFVKQLRERLERFRKAAAAKAEQP